MGEGLELDLSQRPRIRQIGMNVHGYSRRETFTMDGLWSLHLYRYRGTLSFGGSSWSFEKGDLSIAPPGFPLTWTFEERNCPHLYVHFQCPGREQPLPFDVMRNTGTCFEDLWQRLTLMASHHAMLPLRAEVGLWSLLWDLPAAVKEHSDGGSSVQGILQTALSIIDNEIETPLKVAEIAKRMGLSHNHLTRLFRAQLKVGPLEWIQRRRAHKARFLLQNTDLPIRAVAGAVGMADLQRFNKLMRKVLGHSPRVIRTMGP